MTVLIYDLNSVLLPLERDIIRQPEIVHAIDGIHRTTVENCKTLWVRSRLWKLLNVPLANDARIVVDPSLIGRIETLARELEVPFYHLLSNVPMNPWMYQTEWLVEIHYNDLHLKSEL